MLLQAVPSARPTQQAAELLLRATARGRTGQQAVEVLRTVATTGLATGGPGPCSSFATAPDSDWTDVKAERLGQYR